MPNYRNPNEVKISDIWSPVGTSSEPAPAFEEKLAPAVESIHRPDPYRPQAVTLAQCLSDKGYHPVMLFGTAASGKSTLLASLFHYLKTDPWSEAIYVEGEAILPIDTVEGASVAEEAKRFFKQVAIRSKQGKALDSTRNLVPFFIPVILRPNNGQPDIRLAFLESRGEDYKIKEDLETAEYYPQMKNEILDVYRNYAGALSVLVIAPFTLRDAYAESEQGNDTEREDIRIADESLYGALHAYQANRQWMDRDNHLFVLTKWDAYAGGLANPDFENPPVGLVEKLINERYEHAWNLFRKMRKGGNSKTMQYSAGLISGSEFFEVPDSMKPKMNRFPRALLDWLYVNATGGTHLYGVAKEKKESGSFGWLKKVLS